jgi:hypothetical protein
MRALIHNPNTHVKVSVKVSSKTEGSLNFKPYYYLGLCYG